jgi:hypothetical protein
MRKIYLKSPVRLTVGAAFTLQARSAAALIMAGSG